MLKRGAGRQAGKRRTRGYVVGIVCNNNLQDTFGQISVILFCDLGTICWPFKNRRIIIYIFHMDHDGGVIFLQVVRCG